MAGLKAGARLVQYGPNAVPEAEAPGILRVFLHQFASPLIYGLRAIQLLWLNLVTNGIQDVALAFEPAEGDELRRPPRSPREPVFNRLMIERLLLSIVVIGCVAFLVFQWLLRSGYSLAEARNGTLMLMVLFENIQVLNSRSENRSVLRHSPLANPLLLFGTLAAQLVHIGAMYTPWSCTGCIGAEQNLTGRRGADKNQA